MPVSLKRTPSGFCGRDAIAWWLPSSNVFCECSDISRRSASDSAR
jgi:hypothetical protein